MQPYFSIIIPMFNRERFIGRALDSCLNQDFADFEIVVVDDGSTDNSVEAASRYDDHRIKLFKHGKNLGIGPARNTCVDNARGKWLVVLDSDNELMSGSLKHIYDDTMNLDETIKRIVYLLKLDNGEESPDPRLEEEIWNYAEYIKWSANHPRSTDFFNVIKAETFNKIKCY